MLFCTHALVIVQLTARPSQQTRRPRYTPPTAPAAIRQRQRQQPLLCVRGNLGLAPCDGPLRAVWNTRGIRRPQRAAPSGVEPDADAPLEDAVVPPPPAIGSGQASPPRARARDFVRRRHPQAGPLGFAFLYWDYVRWLWIATDKTQLDRAQAGDEVSGRIKASPACARMADSALVWTACHTNSREYVVVESKDFVVGGHSFVT